MERYVLRVTFDKGVLSHVLSIVTEALTDEEALRSAHPVADLAEWDGALNLRVSVTTYAGRAVGYVGGDGTDAGLFERQTARADTFKKAKTQTDTNRDFRRWGLAAGAGLPLIRRRGPSTDFIPPKKTPSFHNTPPLHSPHAGNIT
jgi:hypothetical protein